MYATVIDFKVRYWIFEDAIRRFWYIEFFYQSGEKTVFYTKKNKGLIYLEVK